MNQKQTIAQLIILIEKGRAILPLALAGGGGFWAWIKALPSILKFLFEAREFIAQSSHLIDTLKKVPEFEKAIEKGRDHGDTSALEKLFGGSGTPVQGMASPAPATPSA